MGRTARAARVRELGSPLERRIEDELGQVLLRPDASSPRLAGVLRALAPTSASARAMLGEVARVLLRRGALGSDVYSAAVRALVEADDKRAIPLLKAALGTESAGGLATLSAACFTADAALATPLARAAVSPKAITAFAAEVARVARGEASGARLVQLAPRVNEVHRIELCLQVLAPLARRPALPQACRAALVVLREAERHLGRWLVFAELGTRAGDASALEQARAKSVSGPESARLAWALAVWVLDPTQPAPSKRPSAELLARMSDRPSIEHDLSFLFRLAHARAAAVRPMLETLAAPRFIDGAPLATLRDELAVRAARSLGRDYGKRETAPLLAAVAAGPREELRGLATAALWDLGAAEEAESATEALAESSSLTSQAWGALVRKAALEGSSPVLTETTFRRLHWGSVE